MIKRLDSLGRSRGRGRSLSQATPAPLVAGSPTAAPVLYTHRDLTVDWRVENNVAVPPDELRARFLEIRDHRDRLSGELAQVKAASESGGGLPRPAASAALAQGPGVLPSISAGVRVP